MKLWTIILTSLQAPVSSALVAAADKQEALATLEREMVIQTSDYHREGSEERVLVQSAGEDPYILQPVVLRTAIREGEGGFES